MFTVFIFGSAAATLGGLDSPPARWSAAWRSASSRTCSPATSPSWIGQELRASAVALLCIFVVLLVRPSGLFGTAKVERV